jgi:hypothetical protein
MKKNRLIFSLLSAALIALPALSHAGEPRFNLLCVYKLANGQGVAVAIPGEWQELSKTRVLEPGAAARFLDESGRAVEVSAAALERASKRRSVVWLEYVKTRVAAR